MPVKNNNMSAQDVDTNSMVWCLFKNSDKYLVVCLLVSCLASVPTRPLAPRYRIDYWHKQLTACFYVTTIHTRFYRICLVRGTNAFRPQADNVNTLTLHAKVDATPMLLCRLVPPVCRRHSNIYHCTRQYRQLAFI